MSLSCKLELVYISIFQALYDAVAQYVGEGHSVTDIYIRTLTGLSFKLSDIQVPTPGSYYGVKINIGGQSINLDGQSFVDLYMNVSPMSLVLKTTETMYYPGSANWYYCRNGETHKKGSDFDPIERYSVQDSVLDASALGLLLALLYAILKIGLDYLGRLFVKYAMRTVNIGTDKVDDIYDLLDVVDGKVDTIDTNVDTVVDEVTSSNPSKLKGLTQLVKSEVDVIYDESYDEGKAHTLREQVAYIRNYIEAVYQYLLDPMGQQRPDPDDAIYWVES